jgi:hypothetical protein
VSRLPDLDEFLDPRSLTPQQLYKLQSETWSQGAEYERERIIKLLEEDADNNYYALQLIKGEQK